MSLLLNGTTLTDVYMNGAKMDKVFENGIEVYATIPIGLTIGTSTSYYGWWEALAFGSLNPDTYSGVYISGVFVGSNNELFVRTTANAIPTVAVTVTVGGYTYTQPANTLAVAVSQGLRDYFVNNFGNTVPITIQI